MASRTRLERIFARIVAWRAPILILAALLVPGAALLATRSPSEGAIAGLVMRFFDMRPAAIIAHLNLRRPIYQQTAAYGHFGRSDRDFTWERTDHADALKKAAESLA